MLRIGGNISEVSVDGSLQKMFSDLEDFTWVGLQAAEIGVHGTDVIREGKLCPKRLKEISERLKEYPFVYSVHGPNPINLMDEEDFEMHLEAMRSTLEFSREIGAEAVVYHPGRFQSEETFGPLGKLNVSVEKQQSLMDHEAETLRMLADSFPDQVIAMENARPYRYHSPYCYAEQIAPLKEQVERINRPNVGITLDFGHLHMASKFYDFDPVEEVRSISGLIRHCHVHDNFGRAVYHSEKQQTHQIPLGKGDAHMPVGWGGIDFYEIMNCFLSNYTGLLIMELRSRYFESMGESAENLRRIGENVLAKEAEIA